MAAFITRSTKKKLDEEKKEEAKEELLKEKAILDNDSLDIYTLKIMVETNIDNQVTALTNDMLSVSSKDIDEQSLNVSLNKYPYFTYKYEYPLDELRKIRNYKDRINTFFNEDEFARTISKGILRQNFVDEEEKNDLIQKNIMTMLEILLPTKFPVIDNLHTSHDYVTNFSSTYPLSFDKTKINMLSHLKLGGKEYTINKVVFYNDIINHPLYYQLVKDTMNYQNWAMSTGNEQYIKEPLSKISRGVQPELPYINYENSELIKFKQPNRVINHQKFQNYITNHSKLVNNVNYVEKYHKLMKYLYKRYFLNNEITADKDFSKEEIEEFESILKLKTGVASIDLKDISKPTKEIYIRIEAHDEKLDDSTIKDKKCYYYGEILGDKLQKMILGISPKSYFVKETTTYIDKPGVKTTNTSSKSSSGGVDNKPVKQGDKIDIRSFTEEDINKINEIFSAKFNEKWSNNPRAKTISNRLKDFLKPINEKVNYISSEEYNSLKISHDEREVIRDILKNKFLPVQINKKQLNGKFGKILLGWAKQMKALPNQYHKELIELLKDIDYFISEIKNMVSENEIQLKSMAREGKSTYDKTRFLHDYQKEVMKLYEFIITSVVYNNLVELQKNTDFKLTENKYATTVIQGGRKKKYTRKYRNNKRHRKTNKK